MATAWDETDNPWQRNRDTDASPVGTLTSGFRPNLLPEATRSEKPTKAQQAVWTQWAIRWPCPKDTDPEFYEARMSLLFRDLSGLSAPMLVKAGDLIALKPGRLNVLPSASEVVEAVEVIMAERAAKQNAVTKEAMSETRGVPVGDKEAAYYRGNATALARDSRFMMTGKGDAFMLGDKGERRGVRPDGSVIEPWFHHAVPGDTIPSGWYCRREDAYDLADCFSRWGSEFRLDGARIVERVNG